MENEDSNIGDKVSGCLLILILILGYAILIITLSKCFLHIFAQI